MFELIGKRKAKILEVQPQQQKLGQTDMRPACLVRFKVSAGNEILNQFSAKLRTFLFEKSTKPTTQQTLEGVAPVSDLNGLTDEGQRIGDISWEFEQSGCKLVIHQGATGLANIKLKDVTVDKVKFENHDGGQVDVSFNAYAADLDADTIGAIGVLTRHEVDIELEGPKVAKQQKSLVPEGEGLTPLKALEKGKPAAKNAAAKPGEPGSAWPFPISGASAEPAKDVQVTKKPVTRAARKAAAKGPAHKAKPAKKVAA